MTTRPLVAALGAQAVVIAAMLLVALDMRAHARVEMLGGVNVWGYRGPVMKQRVPGEIRIAIVGGDLAFGWGVAAGETAAPTIRRLVALVTDRPGGPLRPVTDVSLGALGAAPAEYAARLAHFAYLKPDVVCVLADPDRPNEGRSWLPAEDSAIWQLAGYAPALPLVLRDKGWTRTAEFLRAVDRGLSRAEPPPDRDYASSLASAVAEALRVAHGVALVLPPYTSDADTTDHAAVRAMLARRFPGEPRLRVVDLADDAEMYDDQLRLDGVNLSGAGHLRVAEDVAPAVIDLVTHER